EEPIFSDHKNIKLLINNLKDNKVAVVAAAGNDFYRHSSKQGMASPAIIHETISVGAVYDAEVGERTYASGARTFVSAPDRITSFSQRLHQSINPRKSTDVFAPGAPIISSGISHDNHSSEDSGTSQATPVVTGVILLLQEYHLKRTGYLPSVDDLKRYLRDGGVVINDGDDEDDNVTNTGLDFIRLIYVKI
ncbi:MAG: S8 family serine peptidase, partial [Cyanobacteria bacterium J06641_2]